MPKRIRILSPVKLSLLERKMIALLQQNARISLNNLSSYLQRPKPTIMYHLEELQKRGVISDLKTHFSLFVPGIYYGIFLFHITGANLRPIQEELSADPHCISLMSLNGPYNTFFAGAFASEKVADQFIDSLSKRPGVHIGERMPMTDFQFSSINYTREKVDVDSATHTRDFSFQKEFRTATRTHELPAPEDAPILFELADNPRISLTKLSQKIRMSKITVKNKIKRLIQNGVIAKFSASINPHSIDGIVFAVIWAKMSASDREILRNVLTQEGIGNGLAHLSGAWNTAAFVHFHSKAEWMQFEQTFSSRFLSVSDYRIDIIHEQYKLDWLPPFVRSMLMGTELYARPAMSQRSLNRLT